MLCKGLKGRYKLKVKREKRGRNLLRKNKKVLALILAATVISIVGGGAKYYAETLVAEKEIWKNY